MNTGPVKNNLVTDSMHGNDYDTNSLVDSGITYTIDTPTNKSISYEKSSKTKKTPVWFSPGTPEWLAQCIKTTVNIPRAVREL